MTLGITSRSVRLASRSPKPREPQSATAANATNETGEEHAAPMARPSSSVTYSKAAKSLGSGGSSPSPVAKISANVQKRTSCEPRMVAAAQ